jgi:hypothetical protein
MDITEAFEKITDSSLPSTDRWYAFHFIKKYGSEHELWKLEQESAINRLPLPAGGVRTKVFDLMSRQEPVLDESFSFLVLQNMDLRIQFGQDFVNYFVYKTEVKYGPTGEPYEVSALVRREDAEAVPFTSVSRPER